MPTSLENIKKRLAALFNNRKSLVDAYIKQYGDKLNIQHVKAIREDCDKKTELSNTADTMSGKTPWTEISVACPICNNADLIFRELKAKALSIEPDVFLAPAFKATAGFAEVDFSLLAVTVCPRCLFASTEKKDFHSTRPGIDLRVPSRLVPQVVGELQDSIGERQELMENDPAGDQLFSVPRTAEAAILSYNLADIHASFEEKAETPYTFYRRGAFCTRMAKLRRKANKSEVPCLRKALQYFREAYRKTDFPNKDLEYQTCYVLSALCMRLGEEKEARSYISTMEKFLKKSEGQAGGQAKPGTGSLKAWLDKAKRLWEDRKLPETWS